MHSNHVQSSDLFFPFGGYDPFQKNGMNGLGQMNPSYPNMNQTQMPYFNPYANASQGHPQYPNQFPLGAPPYYPMGGGQNPGPFKQLFYTPNGQFDFGKTFNNLNTAIGVAKQIGSIASLFKIF
ncbi:hypothetical protein WD019_09075 [Fictibacillus sp. Mic-4]|uniref:hypothetical protein n=1 Tax=Fictibacillus sp. Mic-4 TaxID=3132826 RepID=UPI003CF3B680